MLLEALHNLVGWDTALVHTLRGLARQPGVLVTEYVGGMRRTFVNPARFCLLSMALWFFAMHLAGIDPMSSSGISIDETTGADGEPRLVEDVRGFLASNLELLQYLSLPFLAFALRVLFRKSGRNLAECLVLVLYLIGFRFLVSVIVVPYGVLQPAVRVVFGPLWLVWAAQAFFDRGWVGTIWRVVLAYFMHMIATVLLFGAIAIPWVLLMGR